MAIATAVAAGLSLTQTQAQIEEEGLELLQKSITDFGSRSIVICGDCLDEHRGIFNNSPVCKTPAV